MLDSALKDDTDVVITRYDQPVVTVLAYEDYVAIRDELIRQRTLRKARQRVIREAQATLQASERVLGRDWENAAEDAAWADL